MQGAEAVQERGHIAYNLQSCRDRAAQVYWILHHDTRYTLDVGHRSTGFNDGLARIWFEHSYIPLFKGNTMCHCMLDAIFFLILQGLTVKSWPSVSEETLNLGF
jgi:hypothetical protein